MDTSGPNLLLVEDHADTADLLSRLFRSAGYEVTAAGSAAEALSHAGRQRFDVLLADVGLPDGDGRELMRALRAAHGVRGVAVTGYGYASDVASCLAAGFDRVLVKPVTLKQVRAAVAEVLALPPPGRSSPPAVDGAVTQFARA